jgi:hypothetical protein
MNVQDYLIDQDGKDWPELLSGWTPPLPESFTIWFVNRFADLAVVFEDRSVHLLDVNIGTVKRIAADREEFIRKIDLDDNANNWLMIPLVDSCVSAGMVLHEDQCYAFKLPPILGGEYSVENIVPTNLSINYLFMADVCRQTRDLPDGTKISTVILK